MIKIFALLILFNIHIVPNRIQSYRVSGKIVSLSGSPIKNASVQYGRHEAVLSDRKGRFSIKKINSGKLRLIITAYNYKALDTTVNIENDLYLKLSLQNN